MNRTSVDLSIKLRLRLLFVLFTNSSLNKLPIIFMVSALDALLAEEKKTGITTNSKMLDDLFGNGIPLGAVTELCGMAGLGKVSNQVSINVPLYYL